MIPSLLPNTKKPKSELYPLAWAALVNKPADYTPEQRAHAKCWLTYRAVDGEISLADWLLKVDSEEVGEIKDTKAAVRWRVSQATAAAYLHILTRQPWQARAEQAWEPIQEMALRKWPGGATNAVRICALIAYDHWLKGESEKAVKQAKEGVREWCEMWEYFILEGNNYRFAELAQDAAPLWALSRLAMPDMRTEEWADALVHQSATNVWGRCMAELTKNSRRLW